jgi:hypothetical protein
LGPWKASERVWVSIVRHIKKTRATETEPSSRASGFSVELCRADRGRRRRQGTHLRSVQWRGSSVARSTSPPGPKWRLQGPLSVGGPRASTRLAVAACQVAETATRATRVHPTSVTAFVLISLIFFLRGPKFSSEFSHPLYLSFPSSFFPSCLSNTFKMDDQEFVKLLSDLLERKYLFSLWYPGVWSSCRTMPKAGLPRRSSSGTFEDSKTNLASLQILWPSCVEVLRLESLDL